MKTGCVMTAIAAGLISALMLAAPVQGDENSTAREILDATGVQGGLVVHLGCGDGRLTVALRAGPAYLVQGLDTDASRVAEARRNIAEAGLYGPVSADLFDGRRLPYIDNLANLVVAEHLGRTPMAEVMRVLAPGGAAYVKQGGAWRKMIKPRPGEIDEWSHFLHGPDNNAVAQDTIVGFPRHIQWEASPGHSRDHEIASSTHAMVSAGGRIFSIIDEGPTALPYYLPSRWYLSARDAFNGVLLWKRPLANWQPHVIRGRKSVAADLARRLVAAPHEVYVTETIFGPVAALDAATGKRRRVYAGTERTEEILLDQNRLYLVATTLPPSVVDRRSLAIERTKPDLKRIMAVDASSGRIVWTKEDEDTRGVHPVTLAVQDGRLFFQNTRAILCLDAGTGKELWRHERPSVYARPGSVAPTLVACRDVVLSADRVMRDGAGRRKSAAGSGSELLALAADTGRLLWRCPCEENVGAGVDVFVANGLVWVGENPRRAESDYNHGRDLHTGEIKKSFSHAENWPTWHHHRCYRDKATEKYILAGRTGIEFVDLAGGGLTTHHWVRGVCEYGIMPCNGLIYAPPDQCACYIESRLQGFHALAPKRATEARQAPAPLAERLEKGPAYGRISGPDRRAAPSDWPTFRHDNARSGKTPEEVSRKLAPAWRRPLGGRLTALVFANGRVFGAQSDADAVFCLDGDSGDLLWRFQAGGRVDSPPSVSGGLAVFGGRDGWIYALRASDGELAWRFQAAPQDLRLVERNRVASVWPVHGSVLIEDGAVYAAAGRSSYFDGGMFLYKLDLQTGRPLLTRNYSSLDPASGKQVNLYTPYASEVLPHRELPGLLPDIMSCDRDRLYLRSVPLSRELEIEDKQYSPHLFGSVGFLEDAWWERTYWIYGSHFYGGARGHAYARTLFPGGRILAFDDTSVYGYQDAGLNEKSPGIFRVAKNPPFIDLASRIAAAAGARAKKRTAGLSAEEIRRTFVWKNGVPQHPAAMLLTGAKGGARDQIRRMVKYQYDWYADSPIYPNALLLTDKTFWMAGPPRFRETAAAAFQATCPTDRFSLTPLLQDALDTFEGKKGSILLAADKSDGSQHPALRLASSPVFDGMIAARGRLFLAMKDGSVLCLAEKK